MSIKLIAESRRHNSFVQYQQKLVGTIYTKYTFFWISLPKKLFNRSLSVYLIEKMFILINQNNLKFEKTIQLEKRVLPRVQRHPKHQYQLSCTSYCLLSLQWILLNRFKSEIKNSFYVEGICFLQNWYCDSSSE